MSFPTIQILIQSGTCTAQCLCGAEESFDTCTCRCGGVYHGAAAQLEIETIDDRIWWQQISGYGTWIGSILPDIKVISPYEGMTLTKPVVIRYFDTYDCFIPNTSPEDAKFVQEWQLNWWGRTLVYSGKARLIATNREVTHVTGVSSASEAKIIAATFDYAYFGHTLTNIFKHFTKWEPPIEIRSIEMVKASDMTGAWLADSERKEREFWRQCASNIGLRLPSEKELLGKETQ